MAKSLVSCFLTHGVERLSHFSRAHGCDRQTNRQTDRHGAAIGRIDALLRLFGTHYRQVSAVANSTRLSCCRRMWTITCDKLQRSSVGARKYCQLSVVSLSWLFVWPINVKNVFFTFLTFLIFQTFLFFKNVGKVQSDKQINTKHFQNNSNEIDLWFFCCMSNDLKCLPINFYLLNMFDALCDGLEGHFLGIRRGVELH